MTQPCHKNTTLNQQCCDSKHKDRRGERDRTEQNRTEHSSTTAHHRTSPPTTNTATQDKRGTGTTQGEQTMQEGQDNVKGRTQSKHGGNTAHTTPAIQQGHRVNDKGDTNTKKGDTTHKTGRPTAQPPFTHHATHHPLCHPPSTIAPPTIHDEGGADRGYPTTRTTRTHTHHPHATHLAKNSARHDSSTRQHCNGMSRARAAPPHWAGQQQHTPPPFHTPKRMDTIHSSTLTHSRSHNQRSMMIDEQQSMFNQQSMNNQ